MDVTSRGKVVLLKTRGGSQYVIDPEKPEEFMYRVEAVVSRYRPHY